MAFGRELCAELQAIERLLQAAPPTATVVLPGGSGGPVSVSEALRRFYGEFGDGSDLLHRPCSDPRWEEPLEADDRGDLLMIRRWRQQLEAQFGSSGSNTLYWVLGGAAVLGLLWFATRGGGASE